MTQELLIETLLPEQCGLIHESTNDGKNLWINGIFAQSNIKNRNGRNYPLDEMAKAVNTLLVTIKENNGIFGELDHPATIALNSDRISHAITELRLEGNNVYGKAKILPTPMGNISKVLIESGVRMGVSTRGTGNVTNEGIVTDYNMATIDIVTTPSAQGAYPMAVYESLDMARNGNQIITLAEQVREDDAAQKYLVKEITKWINTGFFVR
jgi:hypothetical protein